MTIKRSRLILTFVLLLLIIGVIVGLTQWYKPKRDAANEKGIVVNVDSLIAFYSTHEEAANGQYLNKPLQVRGVIGKVDTNADGQTTVLFNCTDPMSGVFCTMRDKGLVIDTGKETVVKGFCSGYINGVLLTDCVIVK